MEVYLPILSIVLAGIAVLISIKSYKISVPSIKLQLLTPPFYGGTEIENNIITKFMACCLLRINNNSGQRVTISEIYLVVGREKFTLVDKDIEVHKEKEFYFEDLSHQTDDKYITDGSCIQYQEEGIFNNITIDAFSSVDKWALFFFPRHTESKVNCTIILETPNQKIKKKIIILLHDETYDDGEFEEIEKYLKTL